VPAIPRLRLAADLAFHALGAIVTGGDETRQTRRSPRLSAARSGIDDVRAEQVT
jgi:hypothetical protein